MFFHHFSDNLLLTRFFYIRNFLKVPSSENFLIFHTNSVQRISLRFLKIGYRFPVTDQKSLNSHEKRTKISYPILSISVSTENFLRFLEIQM